MVWVLLLLKTEECGASCRHSLGNDHVSLISIAEDSSSCFLIGQTDNFPDHSIIPVPRGRAWRKAQVVQVCSPAFLLQGERSDQATRS